MVFRAAKSPLERRLHEVAQDSAKLRSEIKRLQRALKKPERLLQRKEFLPVMPRGPAAPAPAPVPAPRPAPVPDTPAAATPAAPIAPAGELFSWNPPAVRKPAPAEERFAHYFSSTGFLGTPALRQERSVLRNRAIFVAIIVIIFGGLVYKWIFR